MKVELTPGELAEITAKVANELETYQDFGNSRSSVGVSEIGRGV